MINFTSKRDRRKFHLISVLGGVEKYHFNCTEI